MEEQFSVLKQKTIAGSKSDPHCHDLTSARIFSEMSLYVPVTFMINFMRNLDRGISNIMSDTFPVRWWLTVDRFVFQNGFGLVSI